jgi:hypothetical protein
VSLSCNPVPASHSFSCSRSAASTSERYVKYNIIPRILKLESSGAGAGRHQRGGPFEVVESETICFFRARADESVWIEDCDGTENIALPSITQHMNNNMNESSSLLAGRKALVEATLGRACGEIYNFTRPDSTVSYLDCSYPTNTTSSSSSSLHVVNDEEELGEIMTRAQTMAAIEQEGTVLGSVNTVVTSNSTRDEMAAAVEHSIPTNLPTGEQPLDMDVTLEEEEEEEEEEDRSSEKTDDDKFSEDAVTSSNSRRSNDEIEDNVTRRKTVNDGLFDKGANGGDRKNENDDLPDLEGSNGWGTLD